MNYIALDIGLKAGGIELLNLSLEVLLLEDGSKVKLAIGDLACCNNMLLEAICVLLLRHYYQVS